MQRFWKLFPTQEAALTEAERLTEAGFFIHMTVAPSLNELVYWLEIVDDEFLQEHYRRDGEKTYHRYFKPLDGWFSDVDT